MFDEVDDPVPDDVVSVELSEVPELELSDVDEPALDVVVSEELFDVELPLDVEVPRAGP